jgi:hypothetical protein
MFSHLNFSCAAIESDKIFFRIIFLWLECLLKEEIARSEATDGEKYKAMLT